MITLQKSKSTNTSIHYPDLQFIQYLEKEYKINRGIYNTIDEWFYKNGIKNILVRRQTIVYFLQYLNDQRTENSTNKVKFGNGGLSNSLLEFCKLITYKLPPQFHQYEGFTEENCSRISFLTYN